MRMRAPRLMPDDEPSPVAAAVVLGATLGVAAWTVGDGVSVAASAVVGVTVAVPAVVGVTVASSLPARRSALQAPRSARRPWM